MTLKWKKCEISGSVRSLTDAHLDSDGISWRADLGPGKKKHTALTVFA